MKNGDGRKQEIVARKLQKIALMYIKQHQNEPMDGDDSKLALREVIETVHELNLMNICITINSLQEMK